MAFIITHLYIDQWGMVVVIVYFPIINTYIYAKQAQSKITRVHFRNYCSCSGRKLNKRLHERYAAQCLVVSLFLYVSDLFEIYL